MGQQESKLHIQQVTTSVLQMRSDIRNGKVTGDRAIQRCREYLEHYSEELEAHKRKRMRVPGVRNIEYLIETTKRELDALDLRNLCTQANSSRRFRTAPVSRSRSFQENEPSSVDLYHTRFVRKTVRRLNSGESQSEFYIGLIRPPQECSNIIKSPHAERRNNQGEESEFRKVEERVSALRDELDNISLSPSSDSVEFQGKISASDRNFLVSQIEAVQKMAKSLENKVKNSSMFRNTAEMAVLDKKLGRFVRHLERLNCYNDQIMIQRRSEVVAYVKNLMTALDVE